MPRLIDYSTIPEAQYSRDFNTNPTLINVYNDKKRGLTEKALRTGAKLASIFSGPVSQALTYSPEAQAGLFPITKNQLPAISKLLKSRASPEQLRKAGYVFDGKEWNSYEPDVYKDTNILKLIRENQSNTASSERLSNLLDNPHPAFRPLGSIPVHPSQTMADYGTYTSFGGKTRGEIGLNTNRPFREVRGTIGHETQHGIDDDFGRSYGTSGDDYRYEWERGEVRARLNDLFGRIDSGELGGQTYNGLRDVLPSLERFPQDRKMIWDNVRGGTVNNP